MIGTVKNLLATIPFSAFSIALYEGIRRPFQVIGQGPTSSEGLLEGARQILLCDAQSWGVPAGPPHDSAPKPVHGFLA